MQLETLRQLYTTQLQELYSTERQTLLALPKQAKTASNPQLKQLFEQHLVESKQQVARLEQIFESLNANPKGETSKAMLGIVAASEEIINSIGDDDVRDAGLIAVAQKVEHHEITGYGTAIAYAKLLGDQWAMQLLQSTLDEEYGADKKLTALAENLVNKQALQTSGAHTAHQNGNGYSKNSGGLSLSALLLGAAAGAAVGLLVAPEAGASFRKKLAESAGLLADQVGGQLKNLNLNDLAQAAISSFTQSGSNSGNRPGGQ